MIRTDCALTIENRRFGFGGWGMEDILYLEEFDGNGIRTVYIDNGDSDSEYLIVPAGKPQRLVFINGTRNPLTFFYEEDDRAAYVFLGVNQVMNIDEFYDPITHSYRLWIDVF